MMKENYPDTARYGFTTSRWYEEQLKGALALLGTTMLDVAAYGSSYVGKGYDAKFLNLTLRNGKKYWFFNFEGWVQVAEVTTEEQRKEQDGLLQIMFG